MYYIILGIIAFIFLWRIAAGFKKGMVREIVSLISTIVAGFCLLLILGAIGSYMDREMGRLAQIIAVLAAVCVIYRVVSLLFTSLKLVTHLPVIRGFDKMLGAAFGFGEAAVIVGFLVYLLKNWGLSIL